MMSPAYLLDDQRAYPEDEYKYGYLEQAFDFICALGRSLQEQEQKEFIVHLPPPQRIKS